jgi:aspartate racemase
LEIYLKHIGIAAVTAEGAAITYKYICSESEKIFGKFTHPEISIHGFSFSEHVDFGDNRLEKWEGLLVDSIRKLESIGAELIICPSNTPHEVYQQVCRRINIPWLNIAQEVASVAELRDHLKILLLGTRYTFNSGLYVDAFSHLSAEIILPSDSEQEFVHNMIVNELISGVINEESKKYIGQMLIKYQEEGASAVILGCTELPLIINSKMTSLDVLDSTVILGNAAIQAAKI